MQPSLFEEHIIPAIPHLFFRRSLLPCFWALQRSCNERWRDVVTSSNSRVLNASPLYKRGRALHLHIQGGTELLGVEEQGQMARRDRNWWSYMMCNYPFFSPAVAKNSLSYGYQVRFSEEVFNLLLNQKFLCFGIQKQILQATIRDSKKKKASM